MLCRTIVCVSYSKNIIDANSLARRQAYRLSQESENGGGGVVAGLDGRVNRPVALVPRLSRADCVCVKAASGNPSAPAPVVAAAVLMKFLRVISLLILFLICGRSRVGLPDSGKIDNTIQENLI